MDAKICDKCGKTFKEINQVAEITAIDEEGVMITGKTVEGRKPGIRITIKPITQSPYLKKHYDLCPECAEKITEFLSSGRYPMKQSEDTDCKYCGDCDHMFCPKFDDSKEDPDIVDILTKKPDKTLSESLKEKLALPVEGAPNGPATDCKYCGRMINRRKDVRACMNNILTHHHCTYKCTKFEPKEEE